jgi:hypothetical protein
MKRLITTTAGLIFTIAPAFASILTPGATPVSPDTFSLSTLGAIKATTGPQTGSTTVGSDTLSISYTESVYADTTPGFEDFVYTIVTNTGSTNPPVGDALERVTMANFSVVPGLSIDAGYITPATGVVPVSVDLSNTGVVGFNFIGTANDVMPGQSTDELVVRVNATNYTAGAASFQDGVTVNGPGFQPALSSTVPEPASMALIGFGLLSLGAARKRVRK